MTTAEFVWRWLQPRSKIALFEQLLRQQLSSVQKFTVLSTTSRTTYDLWNVNSVRCWCLNNCYWWKGSLLFEKWSHHVWRRILPVSLDCTFLITPSFSSSVYLHIIFICILFVFYSGIQSTNYFFLWKSSLFPFLN